MKLSANKVLILLTATALFSCMDPYNADINANQQVLVIDGFLNNLAGKNHVILTMASPFDSVEITKYVRNARVYITDNTNKKIPFKELSTGRFEPVDPSFTGVEKKSYTLTVETSDGNIYVSEPEIMMPQLSPEKVSAGYNKVEVLTEGYNGDIRKTVNDICEIYYDFKSDDENVPRFRFTSSQFIEWVIFKQFPPPGPGYLFYCWMTLYDNSLRFTNEKYKSSSTEVKKQVVAVTTPDGAIEVHDMSLKTLNYADSVIRTWEVKRIIKTNNYRLNPDSYTYYKGIESQSDAGGKMFDPLTSQLYGNIKCKTNPDKLVLGFFEVSSVSTYSWAVSRKGPGTPIVIKSVPDVSSPSSGFTINTIPPFWIE
jgi:hypothetical protein